VVAARRGGGPMTSAGERWVERYLLPQLDRRLPGHRRSPLAILQIDPDDETEAMRLRREGHRCDVVLSDASRLAAERWQDPPVVRDPAATLGSPGAYDFVLTGYFGRMSQGSARRLAVAREIARVLRSGGGFLTAIGNRLSPIDFTHNAARVHGPSVPSLVTLQEMEEVFIDGAGFSAVDPLPLTGHFGMSTVAGPRRMLTTLLELHWRWLAVPERRWAYAGPLNPVLMLWIQK